MRALLKLGSADWNDGVNTFLRPGIKLPRYETSFDEVRSYTGAIRQVDVHYPLSKAFIPLMVKGTGMTDLEGRLATIVNGCLAGGSLQYQEGSDDGPVGTLLAYRAGMSEAPDIPHDYMYRHKFIAVFDVYLWVALW